MQHSRKNQLRIQFPKLELPKFRVDLWESVGVPPSGIQEAFPLKTGPLYTTIQKPSTVYRLEIRRPFADSRR